MRLPLIHLSALPLMTFILVTAACRVPDSGIDREAMAARVGEPGLAVDALLMDVQKNTYLNNGHNYQDERLPVYLPGNGGLLTAVAMMAAGWDGAPDIAAPGFPQDGSWKVVSEGLERLP